jgi:hypothetical protein
MKRKNQGDNGVLIDDINALNHQHPTGKRIPKQTQKGERNQL